MSSGEIRLLADGMITIVFRPISSTLIQATPVDISERFTFVISISFDRKFRSYSLPKSSLPSRPQKPLLIPSIEHCTI